MKKRIGSLLLILALCFTLLPTAAFAEEAPSFGRGAGTQEDPWLITSKEDLIALAEFLNSGNAETFDTENAGVGNCHGYYFKQTADIDLTGVTWEPIGYSGSYYFAGNYDADGHSITNAVSTGKVDPDGFATAGIFGWVAFGSVKNLHVKNANFLAIGQNNYSYVGGIAGVCYGSSIKNCSVVNSSLESKQNNNNNCAGSIVGYSTGGTFEKCAAENNQVKTMAYGGGFVGEVDDGYGAGNSTFTNCYVANCTVISETDDSQGTSFSGGFAGEITDSTLTIQNCYVYQATLSTVGNAVPQGTGVFAGNLWGGSTIADTNCYYGACGITENAGTAGEKTEEEFRNGTVAGLLGEAFAQVGDYPKINGPADYSSVDAAIAKANALIKDDYKDFSSVETAINSVVQGKTLAEQAEVNAMAKAIEAAIAALQYKDADYTKVDAAIAKANALIKDNYKDFSAVEVAVNAVVRGKNITEQVEVDAMAKAIEDAIAALQYKDADYTKVDEAIAKANALNKDDYKDFSAVEAAINAVVRDKSIMEQSEVDKMAKAIEDAIAALVKKPSSSGGSSSGGSSSPSYPVTTPSKTENGTVTVSPRSAEKGDTVTITAKPDSGYQLDDLTVTDKNGNELKLTDKGNGKYTFTMPASKVEIKATFVKKVETSPFSDVSTNAYYYEAVKWAQEKGITGGIGNGLFGPNQPCTRAQIVTFLWRAAGSPEPKAMSSFADVSTDAYYAKAVAWAVENGITTGTGDGKFSPDATCTRAQSVTFLFRAIGKLVDSKAEFSDVLTDSYYANAVAWAVENGVTNGIGDGLFGPDNSCTRAQIVTFLFRAYQGK